MLREISLLFCLSAALLLPKSSLAEAETDTLNPGPRSAEESRFLYEEGSQALSEKNMKQAIRDFKRFVSRYPTDAKIDESYLGLISALVSEKLYAEAIRFGQELLLRKPDESVSNRARSWMAECELNLKHNLNARMLASELLAHQPTPKQKALALSVRFQSYLEDKQYGESQAELDLLQGHLEKNPIDPYSKFIPEFKMALATRQCIISHLLKNKPLTDDEMIDYFSRKNLCFKSAIAEADLITNPTVIQDWCESFTFFNHELQRIKIDPFLKEKLGKDLRSNFDFAKTKNLDLVKCYAPYKPVKSKKRHRKSRVHPSRSH